MLWKVWLVIRKTFGLFIEIDGEQRAASFAFYAFFSLFPLILLIVSVGAIFIDPNEITVLLISNVQSFIPLTEGDSQAVFEIMEGVVKARKKLGIVAGLGLLWSSSRFFHALVRGVNRAWHTVELDWWKLPLKNLAMLGILASAMLLGVLVPAVLSTLERLPTLHPSLLPFVSSGVRTYLPALILFYGLSMLYKLSPRRQMAFREVWFPALLVALAFKGLQSLLTYYAYNIWNVNAIYGAVGVLIVLLLWIYLCGSLIIFGGCLCSAQASVFRKVSNVEIGKKARR